MNESKIKGLNIGRYNKLKVRRLVDFGAYLSPIMEDGVEVLMPQKYLSENLTVGDEIEDCLVYFDSDDRLIATKETPLVLAGEFAFLECVAVSRFGAFLSWGVIKDLLVPYKQQRSIMEEGRSYLVYVYSDEQSGRMVATERIENYLDNLAPRYEQGEEVSGLIARKTPMGYMAIINNSHTGMIYSSQLHGKKLNVGQRLSLYIGKVRNDDKIDLLLSPVGYEKAGALHEEIMRQLHINGGTIALGDKSSPDDIELMFHCSKKAFKMAIGGLYKQGKIEIEDYRIREC